MLLPALASYISLACSQGDPRGVCFTACKYTHGAPLTDYIVNNALTEKGRTAFSIDCFNNIYTHAMLEFKRAMFDQNLGTTRTQAYEAAIGMTSFSSLAVHTLSWVAGPKMLNAPDGCIVPSDGGDRQNWH